MKSKIKIGTRRSPLALWQAKWVAAQLELANHECELVTMDTKGDQMLNVPIPEIGSKGVFTAELEQELYRGEIDLAVHSAKDMPSELPEGFEIIAFTPRELANDVLVSFNQHLDLEDDLIIGTSSVRRKAMMKHYHPGWETVSVRGNLQTRLKKLKAGNMNALILAYAGVQRMGLNELIRYTFPLEKFIPAVGQGSMAIEVSSNLDSQKALGIREAVNHNKTESCLLAERAFLFTIQGGCSIPAFAHAQLRDDVISIMGGIVNLAGQRLIQLEMSAPVDDAQGLGRKLGQEVLRSGGTEILEEIKSQMKDYK